MPSALPRFFLALAIAAGTVAATVPALARAGGIAASGCEGCHGGPGTGKLTLTSNPATITPGATVELTLSIIGGYSDGGAFITSKDVGTLQALANQGMTKTS